jgi:hypothetical protein
MRGTETGGPFLTFGLRHGWTHNPEVIAGQRKEKSDLTARATDIDEKRREA